MNRRGYAGFVSRRSCGKAMKCPHCDVSLTYHRNGRLKCHYCGFERPLPIDARPADPRLSRRSGPDSEAGRVHKAEFLTARVLRMDADTTAKKGLMRRSSPLSRRGRGHPDRDPDDRKGTRFRKCDACGCHGGGPLPMRLILRARSGPLNS